MSKPFNIHDWQAKQRLTEHTVEFTKEDMATLHNDGELVKADDDGKEHTYLFDDEEDDSNKDFDNWINDPYLEEQLGPRMSNPRPTGPSDDKQSFDDRLKAVGGFSDEEFDDITSRDIESPFPGEDEMGMAPRTNQKSLDLIAKLRQDYRDMSDEELDEFSKEMLLHFIDNTAAQAAAKVFFGKRGL